MRATQGVAPVALQRYTRAMKSLSVSLIVLACALPAASFAQWQWLDKDGRKVFSDRPPPSDIPAKSILKQPGVRAASAETAPEPVAAASAARPAGSAASAPRLSGKDKDLEDKKKQAQAAQDAEKKAKEDEIAKLRAQNCEVAKQGKANLDSGARIGRTNSKGEREILDDAQRAAEAKRMNDIIARECKPAG